MGTFEQVWTVYKENGDEATVHRTVRRKIGVDADAPAVAEFIREMETFLLDEDVLLLMLSTGLNGVYESPSSFMGILLREEVLQPALVDVLLEKLAEFAAILDAQMMDKNVPKLILRELRWLDHVVDSKQLVEKLIAALPAFPPSLQQEIIYILPELASDEDAVIVVNALLELIRNEAGMVVCCIEALGNFNVLNDQTTSILECVLERLDSSPLVDLPVIVKYLIQEAPAVDVEKMVHQIREKLSSMLAFKPSKSPSANNSVNGSGVEEEALILGSIVQGMYFRDDLMKAFVAQIQSAAQLLLLDLWILVGVHSIPQHQLKLEKLLVKKAKSSILTPGALAVGISGHGNALKPYFSSLMGIAGILVDQAGSSECRELGSFLYQILFDEFAGLSTSTGSSAQSAFYQGEIVSAILGYCLANGTLSTTVGLDTLSALVSSERSQSSHQGDHALLRRDRVERCKRLKLFLPSLKQMLDVMEAYSADQVRKMYDILFTIGGYDDPDLCNVLRKQGFHQQLRYRYCGIVGTISRLRRVLEHFRESEPMTDDDDIQPASAAAKGSTDSKPETAVAKAFNGILVELYESSKSSARSISFMLDELTDLVSRVTVDKFSDLLVGIVFDYYMDVLSTRFMDDFDWTKRSEGAYTKPVLDGSMKSDLWLGIDEKRSPVYLRIADLVVSPNVVEQESLLYLSSLVGLVMSCARKRGQVTEIECVLICPLQLMEESVIADLSGMDRSVQHAVCSSLWFAINWIRSVLNFFASETKDYYVGKVLQRLEDLSHLEALLADDVLPLCPTFGIPGSALSADIQGKGKTKSLFGGSEVKKRGRPPKAAREQTDCSSGMKQSYLPLKPEVLNILTYPQLLGTYASGDQNELETTSDRKRLACVELLFSLLSSYFESCCELDKKKVAPHWTNNKASQRESGDGFSTQVAVKTGSQLLCELESSGVLTASGTYARQFLANISEHQRLYAAAEESKSDEDAEAEAETKETSVPLKRILSEYLKSVAIVATYGFRSNSENENSNARSLIIQLQQLMVPPEDYIQAASDPSGDDLNLVAKRCFAHAQRYRCIVEDDITAGVALLKCLTSLLSLVYGFDSVEVVQHARSIDLGGSSKSSKGTAAGMAQDISKLALSYLETDWSGGDPKYAHPGPQIEFIIKCYIYHGPIVLDSIQELALAGFIELLEQNGKRLEKFPTLDKKTVVIYHRVMFAALVSSTARLDVGVSDPDLVFNYFAQAVLLFKLFVCMTKSFHKSTIVATVLKTGRRFIETILRVMPFFEEQFQSYTDRVIKLIGDVQVATRRMQVLCAHGKLIKDQSTASQVPQVKKLLEKFIYRGEALASANGILEFYTTGVLKNRRIDGTTISKEELEEFSASDSEDAEDDTETEGESQDGSGGDGAANGDDDDGSRGQEPSLKRR